MLDNALTHINGLFELISQISALSVANSVPSQAPVLLSGSDTLQVQSGRIESGYLAGLSFQLSTSDQRTKEITDPCIEAYDVLECCNARKSGKCCYGALCKNWTSVTWISSPFQVLLPSNVDIGAWAYEVQLSVIDSFLFNSESSVSGLSATDKQSQSSGVRLFEGTSAAMVEIREHQTNTPIPPSSFHGPSLLRIPLPPQIKSVGCVTWDEIGRKWSIDGLIQSRNQSSIKTFCSSSSNTTDPGQV